MFAASLIGTEAWSSKRCALTWKLKGTKYGRAYFLLQASAHPTDGTGFGLLLTPTAVQTCEHPDEMQARAQANGYRNGTKYGSLTSQVTYGMLPTPNAFDWNTARSPEAWDAAKDKHGNALQVNLKQMATMKTLPTPTSSDHKGARKTETLHAAGRNQTNSLADTFGESGKTSQLNPRFVAEMMGFPVNWTELPFLNGETNPSKLTATQ